MPSSGLRSVLPALDMTVRIPYHSTAPSRLESLTVAMLTSAGLPRPHLPRTRVDGVLIMSPSAIFSPAGRRALSSVILPRPRSPLASARAGARPPSTPRPPAKADLERGPLLGPSAPPRDPDDPSFIPQCWQLRTRWPPFAWTTGCGSSGDLHGAYPPSPGLDLPLAASR